jgi:hypothetical protein
MIQIAAARPSMDHHRLALVLSVIFVAGLAVPSHRHPWSGLPRQTPSTWEYF